LSAALPIPAATWQWDSRQRLARVAADTPSDTPTGPYRQPAHRPNLKRFVNKPRDQAGAIRIVQPQIDGAARPADDLQLHPNGLHGATPSFVYQSRRSKTTSRGLPDRPRTGSRCCPYFMLRAPISALFGDESHREVGQLAQIQT
jgi:hypothetical protein